MSPLAEAVLKDNLSGLMVFSGLVMLIVVTFFGFLTGFLYQRGQVDRIFVFTAGMVAAIPVLYFLGWVSYIGSL